MNTSRVVILASDTPHSAGSKNLPSTIEIFLTVAELCSSNTSMSAKSGQNLCCLHTSCIDLGKHMYRHKMKALSKLGLVVQN